MLNMIEAVEVPNIVTCNVYVRIADRTAAYRRARELYKHDKSICLYDNGRHYVITNRTRSEVPQEYHVKEFLNIDLKKLEKLGEDDDYSLLGD